jgi:hypothetical protein
MVDGGSVDASGSQVNPIRRGKPARNTLPSPAFFCY